MGGGLDWERPHPWKSPGEVLATTDLIGGTECLQRIYHTCWHNCRFVVCVFLDALDTRECAHSQAALSVLELAWNPRGKRISRGHHVPEGVNFSSSLKRRFKSAEGKQGGRRHQTFKSAGGTLRGWWTVEAVILFKEFSSKIQVAAQASRRSSCEPRIEPWSPAPGKIFTHQLPGSP